MYSVEVKNNKEIYEFCMLNGITDINKFIQDCFKQGFDVRKYGLLGETLNEGEKHLKNEVDSVKMGGTQEKRVEIEVIREKRVEIPVEVIKEVEKIVEVPVEKIIEIIKEVPVEKIVTIYDNSSENELFGKIEQLEEEKRKFSTKIDELEEEKRKFSTKTTEMENIFQKEMSKKDEELDELRRNLDIPKTEIINDKSKMLETTLQNLRKELSLKNNKIAELESKIKQLEDANRNVGAIYMKGSNLTQKL
jgi:uncharacterized coiled-coil DUF342 family protein